MKNILENIAFILIYTIAILLFLSYYIYSFGYVTATFWEWFVLPVFPTLPILSLGQAIGLNAFIHLFKINFNKTDTEWQEKYPKLGLLIIIGLPWIALGIGYLIKTFLI